MKRGLLRQRGQSLAEYALIIAVVAVTAIGVLQQFSGAIANVLVFPAGPLGTDEPPEPDDDEPWGPFELPPPPDDPERNFRRLGN